MKKTVRDGPIHVMIVDDQLLFRRSLEHLLELEAERIRIVGTTSNGQETLATLEQQAYEGSLPDVVLMGVQMADLNGIETTTRIQARWPQVQVVLLTTFDDEMARTAGAMAGAKGYLLKDTSLDVLVSTIESVYQKHLAYS